MGEEIAVADAKDPSGRTPKDAAWWRQNLEVPRELSKLWKAEASAGGTGWMKPMGACALAVYLALPEPVRRELATWARLMDLQSRSDEISPENALKVLRAAMDKYAEADASIEERDTSWYISRIIDPEIALPPGEKPSDKRKKGRSA